MRKEPTLAVCLDKGTRPFRNIADDLTERLTSEAAQQLDAGLGLLVKAGILLRLSYRYILSENGLSFMAQMLPRPGRAVNAVAGTAGWIFESQNTGGAGGMSWMTLALTALAAAVFVGGVFAKGFGVPRSANGTQEPSILLSDDPMHRAGFADDPRITVLGRVHRFGELVQALDAVLHTGRFRDIVPYALSPEKYRALEAFVMTLPSMAIGIIRALKEEPFTQKQLADIFGIDLWTVCGYMDDVAEAARHQLRPDFLGKYPLDTWLIAALLKKHQPSLPLETREAA